MSNTTKIYARKDLAVESDVVNPSQITKWKYLEQIKYEITKYQYKNWALC